MGQCSASANTVADVTSTQPFKRSLLMWAHPCATFTSDLSVRVNLEGGGGRKTTQYKGLERKLLL